MLTSCILLFLIWGEFVVILMQIDRQTMQSGQERSDLVLRPYFLLACLYVPIFELAQKCMCSLSGEVTLPFSLFGLAFNF